MKKALITMTLAAIAAAMTGCKSVEVDRRGEALALDKNGEVVKTAAGEPLVLDRGWSVDYFQHWNWQKFDALEATAGQAALRINNYQGGADATNLTQLVYTSLDGLTKLVATAADAYVKVAGGGAQADTALTVAGRMISYFTGKGGDAAKATVSNDGNSVKVTDGKTTILCDKDGNCSDCSDGSCNP